MNRLDGEKVRSMSFNRLIHLPVVAFITTALFLGPATGSAYFFKSKRLKSDADRAFLLLYEEADLEQVADEDAAEFALRLFFPHLSFTALNLRLSSIYTRHITESCHILSRPPPPMSIF